MSPSDSKTNPGASLPPYPAAEPAEADYALAQDPELLADFVTESREHLAAIEAQVLALEHNPADADALHAVFRGFHTIKGIAGFLAFGEVQSVAHEIETLLAMARDARLPVNSALIDATLAAGDYLSRAVTQVQTCLHEKRPPGFEDPAALVARLAALPTTAGEEEDDTPPPASQSGAPVNGAVSAPAARGGAGSVKVDTAKLDYLVDMVGEMVVAHSMLSHNPDLQRLAAGNHLQRHLVQLSRIMGEVHKTTMSMRMVPIGQLFRRTARVVRDLSRKCGKPIALEISGEETELDRNIVEALVDPLLHMVRNAVDHGIEPPQERRQANKPEEGRIELRARHQSGCILIEVADDGRGLDTEKILAKARRCGLAAQDATPSEAEILDLIFEPGFSTADQVTDLSGRGVGMDVVRRQVENLRGRVEVRTQPARGTCFILKLPLTLAIIDGLVIAVGEERYILPLFAVKEMLRPRPEMISTVEGRAEMALIRGRLIPVVRLHRRFGLRPKSADPADCLLIVTEASAGHYCLMVDGCLGKQEVVIKSLGECFAGIPGIAGGAILGDGHVGLILDVEELFGRRLN